MSTRTRVGWRTPRPATSGCPAPGAARRRTPWARSTAPGAGGGVEGASLHPVRAELLQPAAHLASRPGGERDRQHRGRVGRPPMATPYAIRWVIARVLPVPAPAITATGPCSAVATSRCSGSSPASSASGETGDRVGASVVSPKLLCGGVGQVRGCRRLAALCADTQGRRGRHTGSYVDRGERREESPWRCEP